MGSMMFYSARPLQLVDAFIRWCLHSVWKILTLNQQWEKYFLYPWCKGIKRLKSKKRILWGWPRILSPCVQSTGVEGGRGWGGRANEKLAYPVMARRQSATPPGCEPADWVSHLGGRASCHRARSIRPGALPLWEQSQRDSLRELAGTGRSPLAPPSWSAFWWF